MRSAGYLRQHGAVRIDSTHVLALVAHMSRLECVREQQPNIAIKTLISKCFNLSSTIEEVRNFVVAFAREMD